MNRPSGWPSNPQRMANVSRVKSYQGDEALRSHAGVDGDTWLTPRWILDRLGKFDFDPCAAIAAPDWVSPSFICLPEDGLNAEWAGRVFMNPPFSKSAPWIRRHAAYGIGITLVTASIESRVWRETVWKQARGILLLHGRTRFCNPDGSATTGRPLRSIALIAWDEQDARILEDCGLAGVFLSRWRQT